MKTCTLNCTIISPMFSYGNQRTELRPSELKGLMRYMFRAAILEPDTKNLYKLESKYFGNAEKIASPFGCRSSRQRSRQLAKNFCYIEKKKLKIGSSVSGAALLSL